MIHLFLCFDCDYQIKQFALSRFLLLAGVLHLLHLQLIYVVRSELVLHEIIHQLRIDLFGPLVFFLKGLF